ncbi:alpha/beta fold hydrolase [Eleftheria terrae]|uniref:alpha/beta fold hydrolase n=1 Tax=Eleftheria terrae TaxID=1597781 RepID=UPI00263B1E51|nr:alpha/beta hydrolase [Eleftheria terrae]WKB55503.1 alpha/beta hydrolase [Eleftheria terrae]
MTSDLHRRQVRGDGAVAAVAPRRATIPLAYARHVGSGPTIVLVHGNSSDRTLWNRVCEQLPRADMLAVDLRGHGRSPWADPPAYATEDYAADLAQTLQRLEVHEPVLVGHSNGALACCYLAAHLAPRPRALVLVDIEPRVPDSQVAYFRQRAGAVARPATLQRLVDGMCSVDPEVPPALMKQFVQGLVRPADGGVCLPLDPHTYAAWQPADLRPHLGRVSMPVTLVRGACSQVLSVEGAEAWCAGLPEARLVTVEGAGHFLPLSHAAALASLIAQAAAG